MNSEANTTKESMMSSDRMDLVVISTGLAGMIAALRAADLGRTALIAPHELCGMASQL